MTEYEWDERALCTVYVCVCVCGVCLTHLCVHVCVITDMWKCVRLFAKCPVSRCMFTHVSYVQRFFWELMPEDLNYSVMETDNTSLPSSLFLPSSLPFPPVLRSPRSGALQEKMGSVLWGVIPDLMVYALVLLWLIKHFMNLRRICLWLSGLYHFWHL